MQTGTKMHPAGWREAIIVLVLLAALIAAPAAAADVGGITLPDYKHIDIQMANGGEKYIKFDGGGLNALHITTDPSERYGQVTETSTQSGTFYFSDTGGRGFFDDLILMVAVQGQVPDDFKVHVRASGYRWTPTPVLNQPPTLEEIAYSEGVTDLTLTRDNFIYSPQTWRPCREADYPIYYGQDMSKNNPEDRFYIMFVDLGVGAIGPNSFLDGLTDNGCAKIEYSFENLETFAAFNAYGWCNQSNQGRGISWSNDLTSFAETGVSGYSVRGTQSGGDTGGSGSGGSSTGSSTGSAAGSGIRGSKLDASTIGSINGTLHAFTASGPTEPLTAGSSSTIQIPVTVPEGATVDRGLLYVYVSNATETKTGAGTEIEPAFRFDGKPVTPAAVSWDRQGTGSAPMAGTFTLAIPPEMLTVGDHTLTVQADEESKVTCRVPAALLVLVVSDPTRSRIDYWIGEGCDDVLADLWEGTTEEDAATEMKIDETIDRDRTSAAQLYVVSTAESNQGGIGNRVVLNTWDWLNPLQEGPTGVWTAVLDVHPFIKELENTVKVQSYPVGTAGDHLQNRNAILVIRSGTAGEGASAGIEVSSDAGAAAEKDIGSFVLPYNATGVLEEELRYRTGDGNLSLTFPEGSRVTNGAGAAVTSVTLRAVYDLLPVPGTAMERMYRIVPDDATAQAPFAMTAHLGKTAHDATWYRYDTTGAVWQQVNTTIDLTNGTVTAYPEGFGIYGVAMPLPASLTVSSNPAGARIHLDGTYLGRVTPATLTPIEPGSHTIRLELEQFVPYEATVTVPDDTALFADLTPAGGYAGLSRLKLDEPQMEPGQDRTGGIYVTSQPSGATITIDGKRMEFTTPHVIQGIREGSHTVRVVKEGQSFNTPTKTVWVERDCITPVRIDAQEQAIIRKISLSSDEYAGKGGTINGKGPVFRLPRTVEVAGGNSFVTISDGDRYLTHRITTTGYGETIEIAPRDYSLCGLLVESSPAGAEILIDGFRTGFCTPYLIRNVSDGPHVISVTRPGYLPAEEEILLTDDRNTEIDKRFMFRLEPYSYGSLNVTSEPAGAQIYLYNKNTGEVTPHTFRYMPIGTYEVKVVGNATFRTADDVTIRPYEVTRRAFNLV